MDLLRNSRVLITAGPTWVAIDDVRVISNIATGETGILLAQNFARLGAKVTLLLGAVNTCCLDKKIRLVNFRFFTELRDKIRRELSLNKYDFIVHNAAVSDFAPEAVKGKIASGDPISLKLKPLPKITGDIRRLAPEAKLVIFKLESGVNDTVLINRAKAARRDLGADFVVANRLKPYKAFIIGENKDSICVRSKHVLVKQLPVFLINN